VTTPLEAAVREQKLILEHRPPCNMQGRRPESYTYLKVARGTPGLRLYASDRAPRWLTPSGNGNEKHATASQPLTFGPFRGKTRLAAAIDLLRRCYPIRQCGRGGNGKPCLREQGGRCLAPCLEHPQGLAAHDELVLGILAWLSGDAGAAVDPVEKAGDMIRALCKQRRFEEAKVLQEALEDLERVRRSYAGLIEARRLRFAALWPQSGNGEGPGLRVNLVWDGVLLQPFSVTRATLAEALGEMLSALVNGSEARNALATAGTVSRLPGRAGADPLVRAPRPVAVPQLELDSLLAIRRWHAEYRSPGLATTIDCLYPPDNLRGLAQWREDVLQQAFDLLAPR
jgi:hypothetical protein